MQEESSRINLDWEGLKSQYDLSDEEMFNMFVRPAIDDAVRDGKTIRFEENPESPRADIVLQWQWEYLQKELGYVKLEPDPDGKYWYAKKA